MGRQLADPPHWVCSKSQTLPHFRQLHPCKNFFEGRSRRALRASLAGFEPQNSEHPERPRIIGIMRLFAIRIENADTLLIGANDHQEAIAKAGLTPDDLSSVVQQLRNQGVERDQADLVLDGIGPQKFEIRELNHLHLELRVLEMGDFELRDMDEPTYNALYQGYPIMSAADEEIADKWPEVADIEVHKHERNALMADAFSREKTRLMLPGDSDQSVR